MKTQRKNNTRRSFQGNAVHLIAFEFRKLSVVIKEPELSEKRCMFSCLLVTALFVFCVITFQPIEVQTCSAPQNDRLNLSFVKDIYVDGGKLARDGPKTAICQSQILVYSL